MNNALGHVIKKLRQEKGITQDQLAKHFGLSYQAISKWENGTTYPEITLLPELSIFFGVTIDNLFSINHDDHLKRIDNMLSNEHRISHEHFVYTERMLDEMLENNPKDSTIYARKAKLYLHRANRDTLEAGRFSQLGLEYSPFDMELHNSYVNVRLQRCEYGKMIDYYEHFIVKYPNWMQGYYYLIEAYLEDPNARKTKETIERARGVEQNAKLSLYEGDFWLMNGDQNKAISLWEAVVSESEPDPGILFHTADRFAKLELYDRAIVLWNQAYEIPPHYADSIYSLAFLYDRLGQYEKAIQEWERILHGLQTYWNATEGEMLDWPKREIEKLKQRMQHS